MVAAAAGGALSSRGKEIKSSPPVVLWKIFQMVGVVLLRDYVF